MTLDAPTQRRRRTDDGILCWLALRASQAWDFIDKRDIDKHALSVAIFYGTVQVTAWAMQYAGQSGTRNGVEVAAVIAAVLTPYMALQAAAISFYFRART